MAYKFDPSLHARDQEVEGVVWTDRLQNVSGLAMNPIEIFVGRLHAVATREVVARYGRVAEPDARVEAEGDVMLRRGEEERRGVRAEIGWGRCVVAATER